MNSAVRAIDGETNGRTFRVVASSEPGAPDCILNYFEYAYVGFDGKDDVEYLERPSAFAGDNLPWSVILERTNA